MLRMYTKQYKTQFEFIFSTDSIFGEIAEHCFYHH